VQSLVRDLNRLHATLPALHRRDCEPAGFDWLIGDDHHNSVFAFLRRGEGKAVALAVVNMTTVPREGYRIGVPFPGVWRERLNTDAALYGGTNLGNGGGVTAKAVPSHGQPASLVLTLPPLATLILAP
jgi:1,4-alpha-glucan branching enzyme